MGGSGHGLLRRGLLMTATNLVSTALLCLLGLGLLASAKDYKILIMPWFTFQGDFLKNDDMITSFLTIPLAIKHFNERNGTVLPWLSGLRCRATLSVVGNTMYDEQGLSSVAMSVLVNSLSDSSIDFLHGPYRTDTLQTIAITAGALGLPILSYGSTSEDLTDLVKYPTLFRTIPTDEQYVRFLVDYFVSMEYTVIGILHSSDVYGTTARDALALACEERNIKIRAVLFNPNTRDDDLFDEMERALSVLVREKINVIFRTTFTVPQERALAAAAVKLDWIEGRLHIARLSSPIVAELLDGETSLQPGHDEISRFLFGSLNLAIVLPHNHLQTKVYQAWRTVDPDYINSFLPNGSTASGESYKRDPGFFTSTGLGRSRYTGFGLAYDSIMALGLAACGSSSDLNANLLNVRFSGVTGEIRFDSHHTVDAALMEVNLDNFVYDTPDGLGPGQITARKVGAIVNGSWVMTQEAIYSSGTAIPPLDMDRPELAIEYLPIGAKIFGWCEASIALLASLWALFQAPTLGNPVNAKTGKNKNGESMSTSSSERSQASMPVNPTTLKAMLVLLGFGATIMAASIIFLTLEQEVGCMPFMWLFGVGFILSLSSLSARSIELAIFANQCCCKVTRQGRSQTNGNHPCVDSGSGFAESQTHSNPVYSNSNESNAGTSESEANPQETIQNTSFRAPSNMDTSPTASMLSEERRQRVGSTTGSQSNRSLMLYMLGILLVFCMAIVLFTSWQVLAPLIFSLVVLQTDAQDGYPLLSVAACIGSNSSTQGFFIAVLCILGTLTVVTLVSALCVRNTASHEARMASVASLCVFQLFFVGLPTAAAVWHTALSRFLVLSSITFVLCIVLVCTMFLPRALSWRPGFFNLALPLRTTPYTPSRLEGAPTALSSGPNGRLQVATILRSRQPGAATTTRPTHDPTRSVKFAPGSFADGAFGSKEDDFDGDGSYLSHPSKSPMQAYHQRSGMSTFDSLSMAPKKLPAFVNPTQLDFTPSLPVLGPGPVLAADVFNTGENEETDTMLASSFLRPPSLFPAPEVYPHAPNNAKPPSESDNGRAQPVDPAYARQVNDRASPPMRDSQSPPTTVLTSSATEQEGASQTVNHSLTMT